MIASVSILGNEIISEILLHLSDDRECELSPYHRRVLDNIVQLMLTEAKAKTTAAAKTRTNADEKQSSADCYNYQQK